CDATCAPPVAHLPSFPTRRSSDLEHRQRQNRALLAIRVGKLLRTVAKAAIGGEKRKCGWVVDRGLNAIGAKMRRQRVALRMQDRIEMIDVSALRSDLRHHDVFDLVE